MLFDNVEGVVQYGQITLCVKTLELLQSFISFNLNTLMPGGNNYAAHT